MSKTAGMPRKRRRQCRVEWQWTKKEATLSCETEEDVTLYLHLDQPGVFPEPSSDGHACDRRLIRFVIEPKKEMIRKPTITPRSSGRRMWWI